MPNGEFVKTVFLIRHAESVNNVDKREAKAIWKNLFRALPSSSQIRSTASLLCVPMNTDLSADGLRMVEFQRENLNESHFLEQNNVDIIVHSHLIRAQKTCNGLFATNKGGLETSIPVEQSSTIFEKNILEHLHCSNFEVRVEAFKEWLTTCNASNVVVVGHSAFFRKLLGTGQPMANCEVRKCILSSDGVFIKQELMFEGGAKLLSP